VVFRVRAEHRRIVHGLDVRNELRPPAVIGNAKTIIRTVPSVQDHNAHPPAGLLIPVGRGGRGSRKSLSAKLWTNDHAVVQWRKFKSKATVDTSKSYHSSKRWNHNRRYQHGF